MVDNVAITAGTGTTIAADDIGGVLHQRVKISQGADGSATDVSSAAPLQVTLANTGANTNKLLVTPDLPSGASTAAKQPALGTAGTASSDVITVQGIASMTALKTDGSAVTQPVSVAAGATNIAKAEDAASANADVGVPAMAVQKATPANTAGTDGDYEMLQISAGRLWTSAKLEGKSTDFWPMYNQMDIGGTALATDPAGALLTRGAVSTDEGQTRSNFTGSSISFSPGSATFTNGSTAVTGTGFSTADVHYLDYIRLSADTDADYAQVLFVNSDTSITLFSAYTGTGGSGAYSVSNVIPVAGSGATISVASGVLTIASGGTTGAHTKIIRAASGGHNTFQTAFSVSQRVANQDIYWGVESAVSSPFKQFARFHFTGTTNTQVITESAYNPTTDPSANETESNTITLPAAVTTASVNTYRIDMLLDRIVFVVNNSVVATHVAKMPHRAINSFYNNIRILNGTTPSGSTSVVVSYLFTKAYDLLDVGGFSKLQDGTGSQITSGSTTISGKNGIDTNTLSVLGTVVSVNTGTVDAGTQRFVQPNGAGKTILSAGGSVASSGNNTLIAAGTNKLKVFAFSLSTTSTTAVTCIFQSGAGGTELWRVLLQAPTSVNTGANLAVSPPAWLFATASATLLNLNLSSAQTVHWSCSYYDEA